jgi:hypothetical protein
MESYPSGLNPTSVIARESVRWYVSRQDREIIAALKNSTDGLTREQLVDLTGIIIQSVCARVNELLRQNIFNKSLCRDHRRNRSDEERGAEGGRIF